MKAIPTTLTFLALAAGFLGAGAIPATASDPVWANDGKRNMVFDAENLPEKLEEENIVWRREMGTKHQYPKPEIVHGNRALIMSDGGGWTDEFWKQAVNKGGDMVCIDLKDGSDIWRLVVPGTGYGPATYGVCGSPVVLGDRAYIVALYDVFCIDMNGMADGNQGITNELELMMRKGYEQPEGEPVPTEAPAWAADVIWHYDLSQHNIEVQDATSCTPVAVDGQLWVSTAHELGSQARGYPSGPKKPNAEGKPVYTEWSTPEPAPHLLVLDIETGELIAKDNMDVPIIFHGEWSSPSLLEVNGEKAVIFGDGYGVLHGFALPEKSANGEPVILEELWTFDLNPHEYRYDENGKMHPYMMDDRLAYKYPIGWWEDKSVWMTFDPPGGHGRYGKVLGGPSELIGAPTIVGNRAYLGLGRDAFYDWGEIPEERGVEGGRGRKFGAGRFMCLEWDDVKQPPRVRWEDRDIARLQACASVTEDGLCYIIDNAGFLNCWDADTGEVIYKFDLGSPILERSQIVADGKVYIGDNRSELQIIRAGRNPELLDTFDTKHHMASVEPMDGHLLVVTATEAFFFSTEPRPDSSAQSSAE